MMRRAGILLLAVLVLALVGPSQSRPQRQQQQQDRPRDVRFPADSAASQSGQLTPAVRPSPFYIRPLFAVDGSLLEFDNDISEDDIRDKLEEINEKKSSASNAEKEAVIEDEILNGHLDLASLDLGPRLPVFGHHDVLKTTEELRSRDRNEATFINLGQANAGLLPLTGEEIGALNLFPPLRAASRIPK